MRLALKLPVEFGNAGLSRAGQRTFLQGEEPSLMSRIGPVSPIRTKFTMTQHPAARRRARRT
jgi:hypothetical protein